VWQELYVAVPLAALIGLLAVNFGEYDFWRQWAATRFKSGLALYVVFNAVAGALGVALAVLLAWDPFPKSWVLNGIVFAAAGQALLRVEPHGFGLDKLNSGRSILARGAAFVVDLLNGGAEDCISEKLKALDDAELFDQALYIHARVMMRDAEQTEDLKLLVKGRLVDWGEQLSDGQRAEARGHLERFCLQEIVERRLTPVQALGPVPD
jgi:hypothetical protein